MAVRSLISRFVRRIKRPGPKFAPLYGMDPQGIFYWKYEGMKANDICPCPWLFAGQANMVVSWYVYDPKGAHRPTNRPITFAFDFLTYHQMVEFGHCFGAKHWSHYMDDIQRGITHTGGKTLPMVFGGALLCNNAANPDSSYHGNLHFKKIGKVPYGFEWPQNVPGMTGDYKKR